MTFVIKAQGYESGNAQQTPLFPWTRHRVRAQAAQRGDAGSWQGSGHHSPHEAHSTEPVPPHQTAMAPLRRENAA